MEPLPIPKTIDVFCLVKQSGLNLTPVGYSSSSSMGTGFFISRAEAEHHRTVETLKDTTNSLFHVFELTIPNPTYKSHDGV